LLLLLFASLIALVPLKQTPQTPYSRHYL